MTMTYYVDDASGTVFAYSAEDLAVYEVPESLRAMTSAEIQAHLNPTPVYWTDGVTLILAVNADEGWRVATSEEVDRLLIAMKTKEAQDEISRLRSVADYIIAPLQDAVDIDDATDDEKALLALWKKYRVALNRLPDQEGYPANISWPAPPA
ncbi:tail fiber assembly protein [Pseudomonas putida]|uniref:tail fiber assembly protein n=1 Tax=Pseudomonas putida TaxID=303 RepID=UPI0014046EF2|nr:tail fiber assembly protein [Pseudomonas putida]